MPDFDWKGMRNTQYVSGTVNALTRDEAAHKLKIDGIIITQLIKKLREAEKEVKERRNWKELFKLKKKVKLIQIMISTKKMATMLRSGLSILPSLAMVIDQVENSALQETVNQIYVDVESGSSLSQSFVKHPDIFNAIYVNMVKAGESSGLLDIFLDKLVLSSRKTIKIRKSIQSAMLYPAILLMVATVVVGIMMIFVVPVFAEMFGSVGSELPAHALFIMSISNFLRDPYDG
ncbi:type II secretion system F family protein [Polynucleobacter necessarius]|uniref:type II secretion system F family protein n=1 Tax=Polynucleobacter necessarius TaxID=576610 RepID=UPI000E091A10|nr:type II secretion system F family protein [Polynucleobacter necessarius]